LRTAGSNTYIICINSMGKTTNLKFVCGTCLKTIIFRLKFLMDSVYYIIWYLYFWHFFIFCTNRLTKPVIPQHPSYVQTVTDNNKKKIRIIFNNNYCNAKKHHFNQYYFLRLWKLLGGLFSKFLGVNKNFVLYNILNCKNIKIIKSS